MIIRRLCRSPRLALVIRRSANGRSRFALVSVVWILPCWNSDVARLASISRSWAGDPPSRAPLVGVGISLAPQGNLTVLCGLTSELLGLGVVLAVVVVAVRGDVRPPVAAVVRGGRGRVEPGRAVLEREAEADQLHLDLVDRLRAEVADVQQVRLAARDQLAHRVDALALEAVVRAHGEVEVLDRHRVGGDGVRLLRRRADLD